MSWILLPVRILIRAICLLVLTALFIPVALMAFCGGVEPGGIRPDGSGGMRD